MPSRRPPDGLPHDRSAGRAWQSRRQLRRGLPAGRRAVGLASGRRDGTGRHASGTRAPGFCATERGPRGGVQGIKKAARAAAQPSTRPHGTALPPATITQPSTPAAPGRAFGTKRSLPNQAHEKSRLRRWQGWPATPRRSGIPTAPLTASSEQFLGRERSDQLRSRPHVEWPLRPPSVAHSSRSGQRLLQPPCTPLSKPGLCL